MQVVLSRQVQRTCPPVRRQVREGLPWVRSQEGGYHHGLSPPGDPGTAGSTVARPQGQQEGEEEAEEEEEEVACERCRGESESGGAEGAGREGEGCRLWLSHLKGKVAVWGWRGGEVAGGGGGGRGGVGGRVMGVGVGVR